VPVDMVVNTTMAALAKHGNLQNPQLNVYHVASSSINPLSFSQIFYYCYVLSKQHEVQDGKALTKIQIRLIKKKLEYLKNFSKLYEPYFFYKGWFDNGNVRKLMGDMSEEEKRSFEIDVTKIN
ncbi:hypothetical protein H5410_044493, partial [Solanum commersonii]